MQKYKLDLLLIGSILASVAGFVAFFVLFIPGFNVYTLIVTPVIIACYQGPAVFLYWLYKKYKHKDAGSNQENSGQE